MSLTNDTIMQEPSESDRSWLQSLRQLPAKRRIIILILSNLAVIASFASALQSWSMFWMPGFIGAVMTTILTDIVKYLMMRD